MSRYESSRFVKDPKTMNKEILKAACDKLGWTYRIQGEDLIVTDAKQKEKVYGEYVLKSFRINGDIQQLLSVQWWAVSGRVTISFLPP
ncbi:hypothetical protein ACIXUI_13155 [Bacteroides fragilis]